MVELGIHLGAEEQGDVVGQSQMRKITTPASEPEALLYDEKFTTKTAKRPETMSHAAVAISPPGLIPPALPLRGAAVSRPTNGHWVRRQRPPWLGPGRPR